MYCSYSLSEDQALFHIIKCKQYCKYGKLHKLHYKHIVHRYIVQMKDETKQQETHLRWAVWRECEREKGRRNVSWWWTQGTASSRLTTICTMHRYNTLTHVHTHAYTLLLLLQPRTSVCLSLSAPFHTYVNLIFLHSFTPLISHISLTLSLPAQILLASQILPTTDSLPSVWLTAQID